MLAALTFPAAAAVPKEGVSDTLSAALRTQHFIVRYDPSHSYLAELVADTARQELERISQDLGYSPAKERPFLLYVYPTHYAFMTAGGSRLEKFTVGTTRLKDQGISVDASGALVSTRRVLAHEITHAVIFRILGSNAGRMPLWMHEGIAKYESEDYADPDEALIAEAAASSTLIPLHYLSEKFARDTNALAYAESASAVRYMVRMHGEDSVRKLLKELARTGSFETAMGRVTGMSPDEFASAWMDSVSEHYRLTRLARIAAGIGGVAMSILAVAAFLVRRKQKREAAARWEAEQREDDEFENALRRQQGNDWWR